MFINNNMETKDVTSAQFHISRQLYSNGSGSSLSAEMNEKKPIISQYQRVT